jgi:dTDP-glucose pyrophosphorylase
MKGINIATGKGSRLEQLTENIPKSLLKLKVKLYLIELLKHLKRMGLKMFLLLEDTYQKK